MSRYGLMQRAVSLCIVMIAIAGTAVGARLVVLDAASGRSYVRGAHAVEAAVRRPDARRTQSIVRAGLMPLFDGTVTPGAIALRRAGDAWRLYEIADLLAVNPTEGRLWIAYAGELSRQGYGMEKSLKAFDMSTITARREAASMFARALFVLGVWPEISNDRRESAIEQLVELKRRLGEREIELLSGIVSQKPREVRGEIAETLRSKLGADRSLLTGIGL